MKQISINNGRSFCTPAEALNRLTLADMIVYMDDDIRERVHAELAPCTDREFLELYLALAAEDLIIG